MDARSSPQWVFRAHPSNELAHLTNNSRPPWSAARFPAPIGAKPRSMPTQDRVRLDNAGQTKQAWPKPSHPYQQCPVAPMELPLGCTPQGNIELMPKKEILKLNSAPRLEQVGDNCPKQMEHRNHRVDDELILPYRANRADGIFGNDKCALQQFSTRRHAASLMAAGKAYEAPTKGATGRQLDEKATSKT